MFKKILYFFTCFFICTEYAFAGINDKNDLGAWTAVNVKVPITKKVEAKFQFSPRWLDNISDFNQFILHAGLGYKLRENLTFYQSYAWSTLYIPDFRREHRPYNDLILENKFKKLSIENRLRVEERFIEGIDDITVRARYRLKFMYPINKERTWSLVFFDELFVNLNSHFDGPQAGVDQNRIYAGINHKFNQNISGDLGYQLQQVHRAGSEVDKLNHFIFAYLNFDLPQMFGKGK